MVEYILINKVVDSRLRGNDKRAGCRIVVVFKAGGLAVRVRFPAA